MSATHSSRRINKLATKFQAQTYLEIGVAKGKTFLDINIANKIAVDPNLKFEKSVYETESIKFFELTSDAFFANLEDHIKYDIIFLDGLHTFEQTLRDFTNSILHSHEKTVWVIDDIFPSDVYSSLKNMKKALKFRRKAGGKGSAWHGDVYKVIFTIHDFFPAFSYCSTNMGGNPQTFVWRGNRRSQSRFNDLETISRLDYFTMLQNSDLMFFMPEDDAIDLVGKVVKQENSGDRNT